MGRGVLFGTWGQASERAIFFFLDLVKQGIKSIILLLDTIK